MKMYIPGFLTVDTDVDWVIVIGDTDFIWFRIISHRQTLFQKYKCCFIKTAERSIQGQLKILLGFLFGGVALDLTFCPKTHTHEGTKDQIPCLMQNWKSQHSVNVNFEIVLRSNIVGMNNGFLSSQTHARAEIQKCLYKNSHHTWLHWPLSVCVGQLPSEELY